MQVENTWGDVLHEALSVAFKNNNSDRAILMLRDNCGTFLPRKQIGPMQAELTEYLPIIVFFGVAAILATAMVLGSLIVARQAPDKEKLSSYECGFEPFVDSRERFDVKFYLVAILFVIFDLEIAFLFPWAVVLKDIGPSGLISMMIFLGILTAGFIYEWRKGALQWE